MAAIATNRVVAEFYRGVDFPSEWAEHPTHSIGVGLARNRVFSAIILLNASDQPLAACWQAGDGNEQFVHIRFDTGVEDNLLGLIATGPALPVPANAEAMHRDVVDGGGHTFVVLPAACGTRARHQTTSGAS
jgi:hypothetical protein